MSKNKELPNIFKKGYGTISKAIMTDVSFSLESKAIFAYFCALAGSGNQTFPYRSTVIKQLNISKNTYYKHSNALVKRGLISVTKSKNPLSPNLYTINAVQKDKKGYGIIAREIMQDTRLSLKAKGLYAYICALSGKNNHSFPSKRQILKHLAISEPTYYQCLNRLKECGYVFTAQRKVLGRFSINDYYLYSLPDQVTNPVSAGTPHTKICDTRIWDTKNSDTYLITNTSNNIISNNDLSGPIEKNNGITSDPLVSFTVNLMNKFFPDIPHNQIMFEFFPKFRKKIKGKKIVNLSAYMKSSISKFLEESTVTAVSQKSTSYDLTEIEKALCNGAW